MSPGRGGTLASYWMRFPASPQVAASSQSCGSRAGRGRMVAPNNSMNQDRMNSSQQHSFPRLGVSLGNSETRGNKPRAAECRIHRLTLNLVLCVAIATLVMADSRAQAATKWWDISTSPGLGGSTTWGSTFSTAATGDTALTTANAGDDLIFDGTAGIVTMTTTAPGVTLFNSSTFNVTNYVLTTNSTSIVNFNAPVALATDVNLNLGGSAETASHTLAIGGTLAAAAQDQISRSKGNGASSATSGGFQLNLSLANSTISVPILIKKEALALPAWSLPTPGSRSRTRSQTTQPAQHY